MVNATMNMARDSSIRTMPQLAPGVPGRTACGGYRVQPAPVGPPGTKKAATSTSTATRYTRSEEHTSELQSRLHLVCRLLLEKKKQYKPTEYAHKSGESSFQLSSERPRLAVVRKFYEC